MSHIYRCSCCRTRNTFRRPVHLYVIARRCRSCGHRRFYVDRERATRTACNCDGYHHAHRPGSRCCVANPAHAYWRAKRQGESDEVLLALSLASPGKVLRGRCLVPF